MQYPIGLFLAPRLVAQLAMMIHIMFRFCSESVAIFKYSAATSAAISSPESPASQL